MRIRRYQISEDILQHVFSNTEPGAWIRVDQGVPYGAEYVQSYQDPSSRSWWVVFQHPSFLEHKEGEAVPTGRPIVFSQRWDPA